MAKAHYWFGTEKDNPLVLEWLKAAGAIPRNTSFEAVDYTKDKEIVLHFPAIGPIEYWPQTIHLSGYDGSTPRWKSAAIASIAQQEHPERRQVDADHSAIAGLALPYKKNELFWTTGECWFPTTNLGKAYPELNRICGRFGRWLSKHELIYDYKGKELFNPFGYNLAGCEGFVRKVYALPDAYQMLVDGAFMVDRIISAKRLHEFVRSLELRGIDLKTLT
jgi:hypothetical protein